MIRRVRINQTGKTPAGCPIKLAAIDNHASYRGAMPPDKLGSRVNHDISPMLERLHEIGWRQRIVDDQRHTMLVSDLGSSLNIKRVQAWIAQRFSKDYSGPVTNSGAEVFGFAAIDEARSNTQFGQRIVEEVIRAAVQADRGDDLIASARNIENSIGLCCLAGGRGQRSDTAFQSRHAPLEGVLRGIHDARINIAKLLEGEKIRSMLRAIKHIRAGLIDGHRARVGSAIGVLLTRVQ